MLLFRHFRIATSYLCLGLCLAAGAVWVHSCYRHSQIVSFAPSEAGWMIDTGQGKTMLIRCDRVSDKNDRSWGYYSAPIRQPDWERDVAGILQNHRMVFGFHARHDNEAFDVLVSHWLPFCLFGGLAILLRPKPRRRMGLRDMFAIVTVAAIALGGLKTLPSVIAYLDKRVNQGERANHTTTVVGRRLLTLRISRCERR